MPKLLFVGDIQADDRAPKSRKDDYLQTILTKLEEALKIGKSKKVDAVIFLGDIFERLDPPGRCRNGILALLVKASKYMPLYVTIGNHDIKNSNDNLPNSALGTLIEAGVLQYVDSVPELSLGFGHFKVGIEDDLKNGLYSDKDYLIWAFHANISTTTMPYEHVLFKDIAWHEKTKFVVSGHLHRRMNDIKDGVKFVNPGPLVRDELNDYNLDFKPGILLLEYSENQPIIDYQIIELKSTVNSQDVFNIEEMQLVKDQKNDTQKYIQQITQTKFWVNNSDKYQSLREAGQIKKIEETVVDLAIETLREVNGQ
jgi:exonuclease SbcD